MNSSRRFFSLLLSISMALPQSALASSLYSGLRTAPRPAAAPPRLAVPRLPESAALSFDVGGNMIPGALGPTAFSGVASVPSAVSASAYAAGAAPSFAAAAPAAAAPAAPAEAATTLAALRQTGDRLAETETRNGAGSAEAGGSLAETFDGLAGGGGGAPPSAASAAQDSDGVGRFIALAKSIFHPALPAGLEPAVAAALPARAGLEGELPSDGDMQTRMALSPLTNPEREAAVIKLYQAGGAAAQVVEVPRGQSPRMDLYDTIQRQDAGRGRHNLIVVKKGTSDRVVVVGAHHDKVSEGAGTIDNWTGSTMVTNLYQAMNGVETESTFVFIAFAREEEGLLGSEAYVRSLTAAQKARIDSMVNLDTLGVDGTFSWKNNSTRSLLDMIKRVAAAEKRDLVEAFLNGGDADSSTFRQAGIAAMTVFGASQEIIFDIIHSARDNMAAFSLPHYRNAYLLTLALLKTLDRQPVKRAGAV